MKIPPGQYFINPLYLQSSFSSSQRRRWWWQRWRRTSRWWWCWGSRWRSWRTRRRTYPSCHLLGQTWIFWKWFPVILRVHYKFLVPPHTLSPAASAVMTTAARAAPRTSNLMMNLLLHVWWWTVPDGTIALYLHIIMLCLFFPACPSVVAGPGGGPWVGLCTIIIVGSHCDTRVDIYTISGVLPCSIHCPHV